MIPEALNRIFALSAFCPEKRFQVAKVRNVVGRGRILAVDFCGEVDDQHGKQQYHQTLHSERFRGELSRKVIISKYYNKQYEKFADISVDRAFGIQFYIYLGNPMRKK